MLDQQGWQNFLNHTHELFIQPELEKRREEGSLPDGFQIRECLIKLPQAHPPNVEFNDEVGWRAIPELAPGVAMEEGQKIHVHEVRRIAEVDPPEVGGVRVAFVYLYWSGFKYDAFIDFTPNHPDFDASEKLNLEAIAHHLNRKLSEITIKLARNNRIPLQEIGLWGVTSLLPYPISKIIERLGAGFPDEARAILIGHCNTQFIREEVVETWIPITAFATRQKLFANALWAHENTKYDLSIYALIPQVEGVITDWLYQIYPADSVKWRDTSKIEQFRSEIASMDQFELTYREALEQVTAFLVDGPPLQTFENWLDDIDTTFPGRHPLAHGKYDERIFTEENSIKLFLLLDTICQFIMFYEAKKKFDEETGSSIA